jgi:hypothetical protein
VVFHIYRYSKPLFSNNTITITIQAHGLSSHTYAHIKFHLSNKLHHTNHSKHFKPLFWSHRQLVSGLGLGRYSVTLVLLTTCAKICIFSPSLWPDCTYSVGHDCLKKMLPRPSIVPYGAIVHVYIHQNPKGPTIRYCNPFITANASSTTMTRTPSRVGKAVVVVSPWSKVSWMVGGGTGRS